MKFAIGKYKLSSQGMLFLLYNENVCDPKIIKVICPAPEITWLCSDRRIALRGIVAYQNVHRQSLQVGDAE